MVKNKSIVIIGGGASGVLTALALLNAGLLETDLFIVEPHDLGRGRAYAKSSDHDLLNVPADKMSADQRGARRCAHRLFTAR